MNVNRIRQLIDAGHYDRPEVADVTADRLLTCYKCGRARELGTECARCADTREIAMKIADYIDDGVPEPARGSGLVAGVAFGLFVLLVVSVLVWGAW